MGSWTGVSTYAEASSSSSSGANIAMGVRAYNNADLSVPTGVSTALTFNSELFDTHGFHSTTVNTNRLTVPADCAGYYHIGVNIQWQANVAGSRGISIRINGTTYIANQGGNHLVAGGECPMEVSTIYYLAVGDYIETLAYQSSGGALLARYYGNYANQFFCMRIGV